MTQAKHTPGPWAFVDVPQVIHDDGSVTIRHFRVDGDGWEGIYTDSMLPVGIEEREANARLIAAAPTMAERIQGALDSLSQNKVFPADVENAKRLLREALIDAGIEPLPLDRGQK